MIAAAQTPNTDETRSHRGTTYIFAGGGSGGHIFPALAIAERLLDHDDSSPVRCIILCSKRAIDARVLGPAATPIGPGAGRPDTATRGVWWTPLRAQPIAVRPRGLVRFLWNWGPSVRETRRIIAEARTLGDVVVCCTGGFVAAPAAVAARAERTPAVLVNLDAAPGKANRFIAGRVDEVLSAARGSAVPGSWTPIGPVVRRAALPPSDAGECRVRLGLDAAKPVLMVAGASQGAQSIDRFVAHAVRDNEEVRRAIGGWQVLHQCGSDESAELARSVYDAAGVPAVVERFVDGMGLWWGAADLAVSRSGAGMVAEALAARVPTLFMPYPFHRDQHQRLNAEPLAQAGGAVIATDRVDADTNASEHGGTLAGLLRDASRRDLMRTALAGLAPEDGAAACAERLRSLAGYGRGRG